MAENKHDRSRALVARTLAAAAAAEEGKGAGPDAAVATAVFPVTESDTAAAMGHPDPGVDVLGSPRIGLWFELATSPLMPAPGTGVRHVGVGLVVHHLAAAVVGEEVTVEARVVETAGRSVIFNLEATVGDRCVARGVHHRRILDVRP